VVFVHLCLLATLPPIFYLYIHVLLYTTPIEEKLGVYYLRRVEWRHQYTYNNAGPCNPTVIHALQTKIQAACGLHVTRLAQEFQHTLVCAEHDGSAGHHTEHVWNQAAVQRRHAFLFPDELEALREARVFRSAVLLGCLSQTGTNNLCSG
jgi:hypothetical protein